MRLLYIQGNNGILMARRLELDPPRMTGEATVVAEQVALSAANGFTDASVSGNGTLLYGRGNASGRVRFGWRDRAGKLLETIGQPVNTMIGTYTLSPDGTRVAYASVVGPTDVWVMELARGISARVTFSSADRPLWSPDGKQLYYVNLRGIHRKAADGSGEEELIWKANRDDGLPQSVSPDGKHLLFGSRDILALPLAGERKPEPYLQTKFSEFGATFSSDGRWVAYVSDESGRAEIYVQGFPERRGKWLVSSAGGAEPKWRADGKELYWVGPGNTLMAANLELTAAGVRVGLAEPLFRLSGVAYQPARGGRRFLVLEPEGGPPPDRPMVVIQNWAAGLK